MIRKLTAPALTFLLTTLLTASLPGQAKETDFSGRWLVKTGDAGARLLPLMILNLSAEEGRLSGQVESATSPFPLRVESVSLNAGALRVVLSGGADPLTLSGRLEGSSIRGTIQGTGFENSPFQADKTAAANVQAALTPGPGEMDQAQAALNLDNPEERIRALRSFLELYPESVLRERIHLAVFQTLLEQQVPDEELKAAALATVEGSISRALVQNNVAYYLAENDRLLEEAEKHARAALADSSAFPQGLGNVLDTLGWVLFKRGKIEEAIEKLEEARKISPGQLDPILHLAQVRQHQGENEAALLLYSEAYANGAEDILPRLESLYVEKHGSRDGLERLLDQAFEKRQLPFDPGRFEGASPRVVLAELFTGSECPPCQAADYAFEGLLRHYPEQALAVLAHHVHIPSPDPMGNPDSLERGVYYSIRSAPYAVFDGVIIQPGGGPSSRAETLFRVYQERIAERMKAVPPLSLKGTARLEGDQLQVEVQVTAERPLKAGLKLRIALVEKNIRYLGRNRVPIHVNVVRGFLGGMQGMDIEASRGLDFSLSENLTELEKGLQTYLEDYQREFEYEFPVMLHALNRGSLALIAFVQDDDTREVLNAGQVSVDLK